MVYGNFHDSRDNPIFENAAQALAGITDNPGGLLVGDFCLQRSQPNLWGFLSGSGSPDRVNSAIPYLEHTALDFADPAKEPKTAFCMALASFVGDWNLSNNNYLRSLLATPNFGLASMWVRLGLWRTDCLGLGETLGASLVRMVNDPKNTFYDTSRDLAILGDPALRLHVLTPPASLIAASNQTKSAVQLSWAASEPGRNITCIGATPRWARSLAFRPPRSARRPSLTPPRTRNKRPTWFERSRAGQPEPAPTRTSAKERSPRQTERLGASIRRRHAKFTLRSSPFSLAAKRLFQLHEW